MNTSFLVILIILIFSFSTAFSITLLGDRNLISGNLVDSRRWLYLILNWKFILSMSLAIIARISFIFLNNSLLKIDKFAPNATSITALVSSVSYICILLTNFIILKEKLSLVQLLGASFIILGISILIK